MCVEEEQVSIRQLQLVALRAPIRHIEPVVLNEEHTRVYTQLHTHSHTHAYISDSVFVAYVYTHTHTHTHTLICLLTEL